VLVSFFTVKGTQLHLGWTGTKSLAYSYSQSPVCFPQGFLQKGESIRRGLGVEIFQLLSGDWRAEEGKWEKEEKAKFLD
jgi:hypothetical protein